MDVFEENMTPKAMLEKISELAHSHRKLMVVNAELRELLDAADDELTLMRSENDALRKQVKTMEQVITVGLQGETEPYGAHLGHDLDVKQRNTENKVQELEMESLVMKEQNAGLTSEVQSLQEQSKKDKISLKRFSVAIQNLEFCVEEAQVGLQQRDEIIQQNKLQLKQAEETVEEYFNIIKDLRLTNQELKSQLEDREDEASLDSRNDLMGEKEASNIPGMSFAEEVKLLASTVEMKSLLVPCKDSSHEETQAKESTSPPVKPETSKCTQAKKSTNHKVFVLVIVAVITVLLVAAAGRCARSADFLSIDNLWRSVRLTLQPYFSVHYGALPPV